MSTIDSNAIRHAFATLNETAGWCETAADVLRRRLQQVRDDNAKTPEEYGGPTDDEYLDVRLTLDEALQMAECLDTSRDNIRGACNAILGRITEGGQ